MPPMHFPTTAGGVSLTADIEVVIESNGVPDMSTFKATGSAAIGNRDALYEWVENSTFKPALRDGQPVSGVYRTSMRFRVQGR